ncbi:unnamed protein product [Staurois parvus]|uniref:Uncharacterized protein n=1 Tax=Staurois parvus TaxID=386267 RepID=A0ABN9FAK5_9NEOB|nr:unnamed protein product [Staurois parvus]
MRGSGESRYSECGVQKRDDIVNAGSGRRADIVNAGSGESGYSECGVQKREDIVNAGSRETDK